MCKGGMTFLAAILHNHTCIDGTATLREMRNKVLLLAVRFRNICESFKKCTEPIASRNSEFRGWRTLND